MLLRVIFAFPAIVLAALLGSAPAKAVTMTLTVDDFSTFAPISEPTSVDLVISELTAGGAPSLYSWDLTFLYDTSILQLDSVVFGSELSVNVASDKTANSVLGGFFLQEESNDLDVDIDAVQPDMFVLATLNFTTIGFGTSILGFDNINLFDTSGEALSLDEVVGGEITVVPLPASVFLLGSVLVGMAGFNRLKRRKQTSEAA